MSLAQADTLSLLADLIARAKKAGADAADASASESVSISTAVRLGQTEKVEREESSAVDLRVFIGKRIALASSSDRDPRALSELVERTIAMAKTVPEDPFAGLAEPSELATAFPDLDLADATEPSAEKLVELAKRAEDAARAVPKISNSEGAEAGWGASSVSLAATNGFARSFRSSHSSISASVIAGEGGGMERDYDWTSARHFADLKSPEFVGTRAGERAVRRLGSKKMPSGQVQVVYDPRVSSSLLSHMAGAINGASIARGTSFLKDKMGQAIMAPGITVIDEPHRKRGMRSRPCDGEGVASVRRTIIDAGRLTTWILDLRSARQLGLKSTGHGGRAGGASPTNLYIEPGKQTQAELIADIKSGFYVTELIGMGVNLLTGDYSRGAAGFWIENGKIAFPVSEVTVAGHLKEIFLHMTAANDLEFRTGIDAPTLRIEGMTLAGS